MSQQEKIMLRLQYIFSVTKNAQGDFARTSEGAANQMRIFQESLKEVGAELGGIMLPVFTKAITKVNDLLKEFRSLDTGTKTLVIEIGLLAAAVPPLIFVIGQLIESVGSITTAIRKLPAVLGPVTAAITAGALAFDQLSKAIAPNLNFFERFGTALKFISTPNMIAPMLALADGVKQVTKENEGAAKALEKTNQAASQTPGATAAPAFTPAAQLTFPTAEDLELDQLAYSAEQTGKELDEMLRVDPTLQFALAKDTAAMETFGNAVKATGETIIEPIEKIKETVLGLSESAFNFFMQIGSALQGAFQQILSGENVFKTIGRAVMNLIKQLIAAAAAAAVIGGIISAITGTPFKASFGTVFKGLSGIGGSIPAFANGGIVSGPTMGLMGEYMGARSNPEVIAPLDRLQSIMGGRNQDVNVSGQFRLDGQDLVVAFNRAQNQRNNFL